MSEHTQEQNGLASASLTETKCSERAH